LTIMENAARIHHAGAAGQNNEASSVGWRIAAGASRLALFAGSPAEATTMTLGYLRRGRIG
jgi:hypothetical protein